MARLEHYAPPGMNLRQLKTVFYGGLIAAALYSMLFIFEWATNLRELSEGQDYYGIYDLMMPWFEDLIRNKLLGFRIAPICMLPFIFINYAYFFQDSKSIYTIQRLRSPWELHKRCWTLPFACGICQFLVGWMLYWLYCGFYFIFTPAHLVPEQQILFIWRLLP